MNGFEVLKFVMATCGGYFENYQSTPIHSVRRCRFLNVMAGGVHRYHRVKTAATVQQCPHVSGLTCEVQDSIILTVVWKGGVRKILQELRNGVVM
jgi:hypothetical protein